MDQGDYGLCLYQQERKNREKKQNNSKKEKEVQRQKDRERVIKVNEWEKVYKREGESTEIREWMKEKTGGEKDRTYWCQADSSNQTQGLRGSKGP